MVLGEGDHRGRRVRKTELDPVDGRRVPGDVGRIELELAQRRQAAGHHPFAARLVAGKGFFVKDQDPMSAPSGEERGGGSSRAGADDREVGIDARNHRPSLRACETWAMCRSIKTLRRREGTPTDQEIHDAALQFVRKISGYRVPSRVNTTAFESAVRDVSASSRRLLDALA